jgi:hypothetical protein
MRDTAAMVSATILLSSAEPAWRGGSVPPKF